MQRRSFLTALGTAPVMAALQRPSSSSRPPRKVIVGTVVQSYWEQYPGLKNATDSNHYKRRAHAGGVATELRTRDGLRYPSRSRGDR